MANDTSARVYLAPSETALYWALRRKRSHYAKRKKIAADGSFFCTDADLAKELHGRSIKTIQRSKRGLKNKGLIEFISGKYKGTATLYWIIKHDKMSTSQKGEHDILSREHDILSSRGGQNVSPINYIATDKANSAGSASACQGQASPASTILEAYKGQVLSRDDLKTLLNLHCRTETIEKIRSGEIKLAEGIDLDKEIKTLL